jgi:hypothetical protein
MTATLLILDDQTTPNQAIHLTVKACGLSRK